MLRCSIERVAASAAALAEFTTFVEFKLFEICAIVLVVRPLILEAYAVARAVAVIKSISRFLIDCAISIGYVLLIPLSKIEEEKVV